MRPLRRRSLRFLSTPSVWRVTWGRLYSSPNLCISIHTLRVEGDFLILGKASFRGIFLSTPSVWRVTQAGLLFFILLPFLSTPSVWRVTSFCRLPCKWMSISIHTLRVEGDSKKQQNCVAICIKIAIVKSVLYKKSF